MLTKVFQANSLLRLAAFRAFSAKAVQDPLPWDINSLEPVLSGTLLNHHYNFHHKTYVTKYNETLDLLEEAKAKHDFAKTVSLAHNLRFFGGGHYNHKFFWESLAPKSAGGGALPKVESDLAQQINATWGSFDKFIANFSNNTAAIQGSGWGWLVYHKGSKQLEFRPSYN